MVSRVQARSVADAAARASSENAYWRALTLFGVVGWSVTVPTLAGVALGIWIDRVWPSRFSWTLTCLFVGLTVGCLNAWTHIKNDRKVDDAALRYNSVWSCSRAWGWACSTSAGSHGP